MNFPCRSARSGFTLIELLVAITIMLLMVTGGVSAYLTLQQRQSVVNAGKEVQLLVRSAQKKARAGERPDGCTKLLGYKVVKTATAPDELSLQAVCEGGDVELSTYELPNGISLSTFATMTFRVLHGGVDNAGDVVIRSQAPNYQFEFTVNDGGSVSEGVVSKY